MTVKELIQKLQSFNEDDHVVVQDRDQESARDVTSLEFDDGDCTIQTKDDYWKVE